MALGLAWSLTLLCIFISVVIYDKMGGFTSKPKFPVKNRVSILLT